MSTGRSLLNLLAHALCVITPLLCASAQAGCLDQTRLRGVNLSGAEFGHERLPGVLGKDYTYPSRNDLVYFRNMQMNVIRLPFRWERIQRQIGQPLDTTELAQLRQVVDWARELNLCVVLDLHNFGAYHGRVLGTANLPASSCLPRASISCLFRWSDFLKKAPLMAPSALPPVARRAPCTRLAALDRSRRRGRRGPT